MSLSRLVPRVLPKTPVQQQLIVHCSPSSTGDNIPKPASRQLTVPRNEKGFLKYDRDWSRDKRYSGQKAGDTPGRMLWRKLGHGYELYPLLVLFGAWFAVFCVTVYISFGRIEVWLDRSKSRPPWDWERVRSSYWKKPTLMLDREGTSHQRCLIMEQLQEEMLSASRQRNNDQ